MKPKKVAVSMKAAQRGTRQWRAGARDGRLRGTASQRACRCAPRGAGVERSGGGAWGAGAAQERRFSAPNAKGSRQRRTARASLLGWHALIGPVATAAMATDGWGSLQRCVRFFFGAVTRARAVRFILRLSAARRTPPCLRLPPPPPPPLRVAAAPHPLPPLRLLPRARRHTAPRLALARRTQFRRRDAWPLPRPVPLRLSKPPPPRLCCSPPTTWQPPARTSPPPAQSSPQ